MKIDKHYYRKHTRYGCTTWRLVWAYEHTRNVKRWPERHYLLPIINDSSDWSGKYSDYWVAESERLVSHYHLPETTRYGAEYDMAPMRSVAFISAWEGSER